MRSVAWPAKPAHCDRSWQNRRMVRGHTFFRSDTQSDVRWVPASHVRRDDDDVDDHMHVGDCVARVTRVAMRFARVTAPLIGLQHVEDHTARRRYQIFYTHSNTNRQPHKRACAMIYALCLRPAKNGLSFGVGWLANNTIHELIDLIGLTVSSTCKMMCLLCGTSELFSLHAFEHALSIAYDRLRHNQLRDRIRCV